MPLSCAGRSRTTSEGVHRARDLHLPAGAVDAPGDRHVRLLPRRAAVLEHDQHQRLPHARGGLDRGPRGGLHPANAIAYADAAVAAGLAFSRFAPRLSFFFAAHNDLFEEVAKFRVARRAWARVARDRFGATTRASQAMRFHVQTGGSTLTAQQPDTNVVRTTVQGLAACWRRPDLHTNALDEALGLPSPATARLALRTQQVLAYESGVTRPVDPLGGSYYVESLTDALDELVTAELAEIGERRGGTLAALAGGYQRARSRRRHTTSSGRWRPARRCGRRQRLRRGRR